MKGNRDDAIIYLARQPSEKMFEVKECDKRKRSASANSYYWQLVTKLAGALRTSKEELHEILLQRYGQYETDAGGNIITVTVLASIDMADHPGHWERSRRSLDGRFQAWRMIRGSSHYDTREMSILLDGLISECREAGIETMTPAELSQLRGYAGGTFHN